MARVHDSHTERLFHVPHQHPDHNYLQTHQATHSPEQSEGWHFQENTSCCCFYEHYRKGSCRRNSEA